MDIVHGNSLFRTLVVLHIASLLGGVYCRTKPEPQPYYNVPQFDKSRSSTFTASEGSTAVMDCVVDNLEDKNLVWKKATEETPLMVGKMPFSQDERLEVEHDSMAKKWILRIKNVNKKDSGLYECQVASKMKHLRYYMTLTVTDRVPPPQQKKIYITGTDYVDVREEIKLQCNATNLNYPTRDVDWFRRGNRLSTDPSKGITIDMKYTVRSYGVVSTLTIAHATREDQGQYVCRAGKDEVTSIFVNVLLSGDMKEKRGTDSEASVAGSRRGALGNVKDKGRNSGNTISVNWMTSLLILFSAFTSRVFLAFSDLT